ncbi:GATA-domain-containing protein [Backusella circina FSU 941]|nr:GATA-domain-containing protein [Backusella circina FSU 941]
MPVQGEFTRRKNWSQSILDSIRDVMHVLSSSDLKVVFCSSASSELLGYKPVELVDHNFTEFLHIDDIDMFVREFKAAKTSGQAFKLCYRFLRKDGKYATLETRGQFHKNSFFGNARRFPTDVTKTMDTFLDLKMENELLKKKLAALKNQHSQRDMSVMSDSTSNPSVTTGSITMDEDDDDDDDGFNSGIFTEAGPNVYTKGVSTSFDVNESVSLFTGLRYDLGERAMGISMGLETGELINPSMEGLLPTLVAQEPFMNENIERANEINSNQPRKNKKKRVDNEVPKLCTDCGTTESPEWRKGPNGPKTLCNACGLRWSKKNKQGQ